MSDAGIHVIFDSAQDGQPPRKAEIEYVQSLTTPTGPLELTLRVPF